MNSFCPRCGAQFPVEVLGELVRTSVRCPDCRLAVTEVPAMLTPSEDEIGYELSDWPVTARGPVTAALVEAGIPYRWESGLVLVVPEVAEERVDAVLDELEEEADDADADGEEEEADGGEEAQAAMSDLFVAADRLQHAPFDEALAADLKEAADAVVSSLPPYGIERRVWRHIQDSAAAIVSALEEEETDGEAVAEDTRALREFLWEYV